MNYKELVIYGEQKLNEASIDVTLADYLIQNYLFLSIIDKINNTKIDNKKIVKYKKAIDRLVKNEPIQYIIGSVSFYGYHFNVSKKVLIPRFETEELVENTLLYINKYFNSNVSIVDIGTGSGVIGIILKKKLTDCHVTLTDISLEALKVAKKNALNLGAEVDIIKSDMLSLLIKRDKKYDIIISNPPYIKYDEKVDDIVKNNEPSLALYGGMKGLKYYNKILKNASIVLNNRSLIAFEIGEDQAKALVKLTKKYFPNSRYEIKRDLQGRERMFFIFNNIGE